MTPSAGLVEGMGSLSLIDYNQPRLLPLYQLPSPSLCLTLDKGRPLPVLHLSGPLYPKLSTCFEGARLTQLVLLVTASRLFLGHEGRVNL